MLKPKTTSAVPFKTRVGSMLAAMLLASAGCMGFAGCATQSIAAESEPVVASETASTFKAGTYTGVGTGNGGDIKVKVVLTDDIIASIEVVEQTETPTIAEGMLETFPQAMVDAQSVDVDTVSGATMTSMGIRMAVIDALEQAGGTPAMLHAVEQPQVAPETIEMTTDTVVVGAGGAGMAATVRLEELGHDVILVEKTYRLGGSISVSGGNQVVQGSKLQAEAGVTDDSAESMVEDFQKNGEDMCVPELIELYAENVGETTDWVHEYVGVEYNMEGGLHNLAEYSHNRELAYEGGGAGATETFREAVAESGAEVLTNTCAEELIVEDGKVCGVRATDKDGNEYVIHADNVVLATGGYGNSTDWLTDELKNNSLYYGVGSSTGDGLTMATAEGVDAATLMLDYAKQYPNGVEVSAHRAKSTIDGNLVVWPMSAILINPEGERVVNEHASNHDILEVELEQTDSMLYLLMDQENFDAWSEKLAGTGFNAQKVEGYLEANGSSTPKWMHGETVADLAEVAGIDEAVLQKTIDDYNDGVEAGKDEFGRDGDYLQMKIGEGPYYMIEQKPRYATTMGGLVVNTDLQVINTDGDVIAGLYAAGEVVGGVHGSNSPSGANNGWVLTSGKLAADAIAEAAETTDSADESTDEAEDKNASTGSDQKAA